MPAARHAASAHHAAGQYHAVLAWSAALTFVLGAACLPNHVWAQRSEPPASAPAGTPQMDLPRLDMSVHMHRIHAQVAATPRQREVGLMFRQQMPEYEGMLFVFEQPATQCFWMKNTFLPLTAAFIADDGRITNLVDMTPFSSDSHCSSEPVRYVLEMNRGWFEKRKITAGTHLRSTIFSAPTRPD
ncbi:DUF192 domain-containing protein [Corticibacter populi]|uniref:DUF192 domain-containing protein n=1 Tax=Corticibacter populi TaxID=1550736 RepID=A0A3M6QYQ0_9BURK|nr:DUF192 domain-containing protein [Corticibacter populi]RMX07642.1 DUF192 domain-containing protein [Corticibacter populi]RZS30145.1 hypothetical protein EV687_3638 [Corticibacter populi]